MRITKQIALEVAEKMAKPTFDRVKEIKNQMYNLLRDYHMMSIPHDVVKLQKEYPSYFKTTNSISIEVGNFKEGVGGGESIIVPANTNTLYINEISDKALLCKLEKSSAKKQRLKEKGRRLERSIESSLLQLGTYKRVQDSFNEAYGYLPSVESRNLPALEINSIRELLKEQQS